MNYSVRIAQRSLSTHGLIEQVEGRRVALKFSLSVLRWSICGNFLRSIRLHLRSEARDSSLKMEVLHHSTLVYQELIQL